MGKDRKNGFHGKGMHMREREREDVDRWEKNSGFMGRDDVRE